MVSRCLWINGASIVIDSGSIAQSKESRFDHDSIIYKAKSTQTHYEFCEERENTTICKDTHGPEVVRSVE